jgi:hypothetical protein
MCELDVCTFYGNVIVNVHGDKQEITVRNFVTNKEVASAQALRLYVRNISMVSDYICIEYQSVVQIWYFPAKFFFDRIFSGN